MSILSLSIVVFITQVIFIGFRTWNVSAIAEGNIPKALASGFFVNISWLVSVAIGATSMYEIVANFEFKFLPVVFASVTGGLLGTYIAMRKNQKKKTDFQTKTN